MPSTLSCAQQSLRELVLGAAPQLLGLRGLLGKKTCTCLKKALRNLLSAQTLLQFFLATVLTFLSPF